MTLDSTAYDAVLKDYYTKDKIEEQSFLDNPAYAMFPKKMAGGRRYPQPVEFGRPTNASATFTRAMTDATNSKYDDFLLTRVHQYQRVLVDHELLLATEKADEAFQPAFEEFDKGFRGLGEKMARRLYRTSTGSIGQLANSSVATAVATLADKADTFNFEVDTVVQFSDTDGSALLDSGETLTVIAVDTEEGTVTFNALLNTIAGIGTNDFMYQAGDHNLGMAGLADWLPAGSDRATKLAASFFGVTRSSNPQRLGGVVLDGTTLGGIDEILIKLVAKQAKYGGRPSHVFMNPETFSDLQLLANGKTFISQSIETQVKGENGDYVIGFPGLKVNIGGFNVRIYGDVNCPSNRIYSLQMNTWKLWHTGPLPMFLGEKFLGGRILKPAETEDSMEARIGCYWQMGCSAPGKNAVATVPVA
jgi:hypothetical protein